MIVRGFGLVVALVVGQVAVARSNSRLAVTPDGRWLLAANTDGGTLALIDLEARALAAQIPVGRAPEGVCLAGGGSLAVVTLWDDDQLAVIDLATRALVRKIDVPDEPYGVVASADGSKVYVTHAYPGVVTEVDPQSGAILRRFSVGDFPRGIAIEPGGQRLLVSHYYNGWLSAIDLETGNVVDRWKGAVSDNLARQVAIHPSRPLAYVPHIRSRVERARGTGSIFPFVTLVDLAPGDGKRRTPIAMDNYNGVAVPADPWETAISPDGRRQYTIYGGTDDLNVSAILDDYPYLEPLDGLVPVGAHPRGLATSPDGRELYVLNGLDFDVWVMRADPLPLRKLAAISIGDDTLDPAVRRGKRLFHMAGNPMSSRRWISCASCHPGGDHDGRTWKNPEGLRNTTALFGMSRTHPLHWSADRDEVQDFEHTIRGPLMQGSGLARGELPDPLGEPIAGRSADLDALAAYCNSLEPTPSPHAEGPGKLSAAAERGRVLFESAATGCADCHPSPNYADGRREARPPVRHDVGTGGDPTDLMGPEYDAPSLIGVYRSAPYLHDGRAATLLDVLTAHNRDDRHGRTQHLGDGERADLVEFLRSLPYEPGPAGPH